MSTLPRLQPLGAGDAHEPSVGDGLRLAPVPAEERSVSKDVIRGVAVLGILTMNVLTFGLHEAAYQNPLYAGGFASGVDGSLDRAAYILQSLLCDQRFMTIFAMLFGAAIVTATERADRARASGMQTPSAAVVHYRRAAILIGLGLLHAYGLWYGDVLFLYGVCALWLFPARKLSAGAMAALGGALLLIPIVITGGLGALMWWWHGTSILEISQLVDQGAQLTSGQASEWQQWQDAQQQWKPTAEQLAHSTAMAKGSAGEVWERNAGIAAYMQAFMLPMWGIWRATGLMLLGMACRKWGVFRGQLGAGVYVNMMLMGYGIGLPLAGLAVYDGLKHDMFMPRTMVIAMQLQYVASIAVALGHVGLIVLATRWVRQRGARWMVWLTESVACAGRMSLTNYLLQTVVMLAIFSGWGFGLFESLPRWQLLALVPFVWVAQILFSRAVLSRYRNGPMEALTRTIVYA